MSNDTEGAEVEATTLIGRSEEEGAKSPAWAERLCMLGAGVGAIYLGILMWEESTWSQPLLWTASICGLPLLALATTEACGRIIQKFHTKNE